MNMRLIVAAGLAAALAMPLAAQAQKVAGATQEYQAYPATSIEFSAQEKKQEKKEEVKKTAPAQRAAPQRAAPRQAAPQRQERQQRVAPQRTAPRQAAPQRQERQQRAVQQKATPRVASPRRTQPRVVAPARTAPRTVTRSRTNTRAVSQPNATPKATTRSAARVITPRGTRAVTASRLRSAPARGAGRTVIRGQNYSVWRSGYRVRHSGGWRTFVALSTLSAILVGSNEYYPYAYVTAPEDYCQGLTADGCELNWEQVQTIEGDIIDQCVAYCPWQ